MPRPSLEHEVRQAVREYLHMAETLSSEEAPLNALAVAERLNFNRKTLKKYGLDADIASAAERQSRNGELSPKIKARRSMNNMLRDRSQEIEALRHRAMPNGWELTLLSCGGHWPFQSDLCRTLAVVASLAFRR